MQNSKSCMVAPKSVSGEAYCSFQHVPVDKLFSLQGTPLMKEPGFDKYHRFC